MTHNIAYILERIALFFYRFGYGRGFGVQSPWAFSLVTKAICKPITTELKKHLAQQLLPTNLREQKVGALCYRIAHHLKAFQWQGVGAENPYLSACLTFGEEMETPVFYASPADLLAQKKQETPCAYWLDCDALSTSFLDEMLQNVHSDTFFILPNVYHDKHQKALWKHLETHPNTSVSFDLYYCALVFCNKKLQKQTHWVYF